MPVIRSQIDTRSPEFAANAESLRGLTDELHARLAKAALGGGEKARNKHTERGKLLPRERIRALLDPGSPFLEIAPLAAEDMYEGAAPAAGVIAGIGRVQGLEVLVIANDATVKGGTYFPMTVKKHLRAQEVAAENNLPCVYLVDSGGAFLPLDPVWPKWVVAVVLLAIYAWYVKHHFEEDPEIDLEDLAPLRFQRLDRSAPYGGPHPLTPRLRVVNVQVLFALGCIVVGAFFFVDAIEEVAASIGVDELLLALVVAPIATELPEKFNSIIWVRQGKDTLAMGNITGAMVFQSTIPTVVALLFASSAWHIGEGSYTAFASAAIALAASAAIFLPLARRGTLAGRNLLIGGAFYLVYLGLVIVVIAGGAA